MQNVSIDTLGADARKDYYYWKHISDDSSDSPINNTVAYYARFFEGISNGLNAIYRYHSAEEYVGRFLERHHIFSEKEEGYDVLAERLVEEMMLSGNSPVVQLDVEKVKHSILQKMKRWYYLLDSLPDEEFKKHKEDILHIYTYDITTVFFPSNLDIALLNLYNSQFLIRENELYVMEIIGKKLNVPRSFVSYLYYTSVLKDGWDGTSGEEELKEFLPQVVQIVETISRNPLKDMDAPYLNDLVQSVSKSYANELQNMDMYMEGVTKLTHELESIPFPLTGDTIQQAVKQSSQVLASIPSYPSNAFDDRSLEKYIEEKWKRWQHFITEENKQVLLPVAVHDMLRVFFSRNMDAYLVQYSRMIARNNTGMLTIVSGVSLKYSIQCIKYTLFKQQFPDWDKPFQVRAIPHLSAHLKQALEYVSQSYARFSKLPKNKYAPLVKNFTSFYTTKKIIETYFDQEQSMENIHERINNVYKNVIRKDPGELSFSDKAQELQQYVIKNPKQVSENYFDGILFFIMLNDMQEQDVKTLEELLHNKKNREKYQQLVFYRFDAFTFNRILATNYGGLANLFGTKGFIILIEAYLVGSGIEHLINASIEGSIGTIFNIFQALDPAYIGPIFSTRLDELSTIHYNLSLNSMWYGFSIMNWNFTLISLFIPILLMFLITSYNYLFYKMGRERNRGKSFKRLTATTDRWVEQKPHLISFATKQQSNVIFEGIKTGLLLFEVIYIIILLYNIGFEPTQLALFFFLLSTICLSTYQGNKLKDEVTLGQSETVSDTIRDFIFIPIVELGRYLGGQVKSINFIPWLIKEGVEPLYRVVIYVLHSFISFQREKKEEII